MKSLIVILFSLVVHFAMSDFVSAENSASKTVQRSEADLKRDQSSKPQQILNFLGVKKGDAVLDFLGGGGYYSQLLAERVGAKGKVVLHTNQAYMKYVGKKLETRTASGGLNKVTRLLSEAKDLKFGEEQFDSAILVLGYHDFFFKDEGWDFPSDTVIPQLHKSLKKGGKLLIIDHSAKKDSGISVAKSLHRIEDSYVMKDILNRGFKFVKQTDLLRNSEDSREVIVFDPKIRRKTDRFVYLFEKI